jgi:hypothetical protein
MTNLEAFNKMINDNIIHLKKDLKTRYKKENLPISNWRIAKVGFSSVDIWTNGYLFKDIDLNDIK